MNQEVRRGRPPKDRTDTVTEEDTPLPEGYRSMDTAPKDRPIRLLTPTGYAILGIHRRTRQYSSTDRRWNGIGYWADPITLSRHRFEPRGWKEDSHE